MSQDQERIARLETKVEIFTEWMEKIDDRLRDVERHIWKAIGALIAADLAMRFFIK